MEKIVIIGGGGTGAALAHDLVLRGFEVILLEKGELTSGTTGRHHGLLHSGARYAVDDPEAATECILENQILKNIAPGVIEKNDGLFVAITEDEVQYSQLFINACVECGIPLETLTPENALQIEPALNPDLKLAVRVPDATFDAWRLPLSFFATAQLNGGKIHPFCEVTGFHKNNQQITAASVVSHATGKKFIIEGDYFINATGAWAGKIAKMANVHLPIQPGPGIMVAIEKRVTNMAINRLHPAGEGDIIVPQRLLSVLGTSLWLDDDPDKLVMRYEDIQRMIELCSQMVPEIQNIPIRASWCAARPLIKPQQAIDDPQKITRSFDCYDHEQEEGIKGFVSIIGGKGTTLRRMAELASDLICQKTNRHIACATHSYPLVSYRKYYQKA
ncbi:MAG: FAD-dependent oxidoreductase [Spirochaetes bacterium]|nr:FAD-dependent oxidoreductase [Spirochaetota bacterium]